MISLSDYYNCEKWVMAFQSLRLGPFKSWNGPDPYSSLRAVERQVSCVTRVDNAKSMKISTNVLSPYKHEHKKQVRAPKFGLKGLKLAHKKLLTNI